MPEKDWRTDNWGGYHDYNRDPRQYHFPHTAKEIGWSYPDKSVETSDFPSMTTLVVVAVIVVVLLFLIAWVEPVQI